jgi:ubiquitin carboxyl-terminal hydrolase 4/11/15
LSDKLDNMVHFPIDGLDLEDRIGERKMASSLQLDDGELREMGIEQGKEPMIYDLCE